MTGGSFDQLPLPLDGYALADLPDRIASKIRPEPDGCWRWIGATTGEGYGAVRHGGRLVSAHRVVYRLLADSGLSLTPGRGRQVIDHTCRTRACVNPAHLEVVGNRENTLRGRCGVLGEHSSAFVGVRVDHGRYRVSIRVDGVSVNLGRYPSGEDAAAIYDAAALVLYGDATNHRLGRLAHPPSPLLLDVARGRIERARSEEAS